MAQKMYRRKVVRERKSIQVQRKDAGRSADDTGSLSGIHRRARKSEKRVGYFLRKAELLPKWYTS